MILKKKDDGTFEMVDDEIKVGKLEATFVFFIAIFLILPLAMFGLFLIKIFDMEDRMAKRIAEHIDRFY